MHKDSTLMELDIMYLQASQNSPWRFHILFFCAEGFFWGGGAVFEWVPAQNADIHHMLLLFKKKNALVFGTI